MQPGDCLPNPLLSAPAAPDYGYPVLRLARRQFAIAREMNRFLAEAFPGEPVTFALRQADPGDECTRECCR